MFWKTMSILLIGGPINFSGRADIGSHKTIIRKVMTHSMSYEEYKERRKYENSDKNTEQIS